MKGLADLNLRFSEACCNIEYNNFRIFEACSNVAYTIPFKEVRIHIYTVVIKADQDIVSLSVPGNVTGDAAGNENQPSNVLQVMHYPAPKISHVFYGSTTGSFVVMIIAAGLLTVSIASLNSIRESSSPFPSPSQSESNLFV
uniref:Uncharacterized protein n=1 Tax=Quercus lobata TaxID=97700 RepID=A0A7N2MNJ5_QUELO